MQDHTTRSAQLEIPFAPLCQCGCGQPLQIAKHPKKQTKYLPNHHQKCSKGTIDERFWAKVNKNGPNGCWLWTGVISRGYGRFNYQKRMQPSARVAWELTNGPIPEGLLVCHDCPGRDNPMCVNPSHMFLGTPKDNTQDMLKKGRNSNAKGEAQGHAVLTDIQVLEIRELYALGGVTQAQLAAKFGVKPITIHPIVTGRTWTHVGGPITHKYSNEFRNHNQVLTAKDVGEIRRRYAEGGVLYRELATEYGVGRSTIDSIVRRTSWKNV